MEGLSVEPGVHDLLGVTGPDALVPVADERWPSWVVPSLAVAPWVVVRRAPPAADGALAVGIRGRSRSERVAARLAPAGVVGRRTPEELPGRLRLLPGDRQRAVPAFDALHRARDVLVGFGLVWGPGGSVGFELATGFPAARTGSDLDLVVRVPAPMCRPVAARVAAALAALPVRCDARLETPHGGVSLAEYARDEGPVLLRTARGPRLVADPWRP